MISSPARRRRAPEPKPGGMHHFILMRHCVRSTTTEINHLGDDFPSELLEDYVGVEIPKWDVPYRWCTEAGSEQAEEYGELLLKDQIISPGRIQLEIISDESLRDVDTAYKVTQGLRRQKLQWKQTSLAGLHDLSLVSWLSEWEGICPKEYTHAETKAARLRRFSSLEAPSVTEGLLLMKRALGEKSVSLESLPKEVELTSDLDGLSGTANLLAKAAENLFFRRASRIPFAPNATTEDVYELLQWYHYKRSVLDVGTPEAASYGAVLGGALLGVLKDGYFKKRTHHIDDSYDARVTLLAAHDFDLTALATALDVHWKLKPPYIWGRGNTSYLPTPPLSGIHVWRNATSGDIGLSFLYPVFSDRHWKDMRLESTPVLFNKEEYVGTVNQGIYLNGAARASVVSGMDAVDRLERQIQATLRGFTGATSCLAKFQDYRSQLQPPGSVHNPWKESWASCSFRLLSALLVANILVLLYVRVRRGRKRGKAAAVAITEPQSEMNIDADVYIT